MTGPEFRALRLSAGLSYRRAAAELGVALSTVQRWEQGRTIPSEAAERITELAGGAPTSMVLARALGRVAAALSDKAKAQFWLAYEEERGDQRGPEPA